jgi:hypothetical protein
MSNTILQWDQSTWHRVLGLLILDLVCLFIQSPCSKMPVVFLHGDMPSSCIDVQGLVKERIGKESPAMAYSNPQSRSKPSNFTNHDPVVQSLLHFISNQPAWTRQLCHTLEANLPYDIILQLKDSVADRCGGSEKWGSCRMMS